jgi:hypothetical protein
MPHEPTNLLELDPYTASQQPLTSSGDERLKQMLPNWLSAVVHLWNTTCCDLDWTTVSGKSAPFGETNYS